MKTTLATLVITLCSSLNLPCSAQWQDDSAAKQVASNIRFIETRGTFNIDVKPDEVIINLGVKTFNLSLNVAKSENDTRTKEVVALVKKYGLEPIYVQTSAMTIEPVRKGASDAERLIGYKVERQITLDVKDIDKVEGLLSDLVKNGANSVQGVEFKTTQIRKYKDQARVEAAKAAREKADLLAGALGAKLGKVRIIKEDPYADVFQRYSLQGATNGTIVPAQGSFSDSSGTFAAGKISVQSNLDVVFDLE